MSSNMHVRLAKQSALPNLAHQKTNHIGEEKATIVDGMRIIVQHHSFGDTLSFDSLPYRGYTLPLLWHMLIDDVYK